MWTARAAPPQGYNVVIHEFIHKIDMRDGVPDGCPPLPTRAARETWLAVMQAEYEAFREKRHHRRALRWRADLAGHLRGDRHRRILRRGLRSLLRQPSAIRR
jgi:hypothetical protein